MPRTFFVPVSIAGGSSLSPAVDLTLAGGQLAGVSMPGTVPPPSTAPTAALGAATGLTGTYSYKVTFVRGGTGEETDASAQSNNVTPANQKLDVTAIPTSPDSRVTARRLYRTAAGGATWLFRATIPDNTTTTFSNDELADGSLGAAVGTVWTPANLTFQFSVDGVTYQDLYNGAEAVVTTAAARFVAIDPTARRAIRFLKVRSGTAGAPVTQAATRTLSLVVLNPKF